MKAYLFSFLAPSLDSEPRKQYVLIYAENAWEANEILKHKFQFVNDSIKNLTFE